MWLMRAPRRGSGDACLAALRSSAPDQPLMLRVATASPRTRRSIRELVEAHAYAAHCEVALTETRGIAVRWVDGFVAGTPEQLARFLATVGPVLQRSHGETVLAA